MGGQQGEAETLGRHDVQGLQVHRGLRQPHAFRLAAEAMLEIPETPDHLGDFVAPGGQRHDHVAVGLGQGRAVTGETLPALAVRFQDGGVDIGRVLLQPGEEGRAEIETDATVVVDDPDDAALAVQDPAHGIGGVALGRDPPVPVVVRVGRVLDLDRLQPRVLARRLVEVTVNAEIAFHNDGLQARSPFRGTWARFSETRCPGGAG